MPNLYKQLLILENKVLNLKCKVLHFSGDSGFGKAKAYGCIRTIASRIGYPSKRQSKF